MVERRSSKLLNLNVNLYVVDYLHCVHIQYNMLEFHTINMIIDKSRSKGKTFDIKKVD